MKNVFLFLLYFVFVFGCRQQSEPQAIQPQQPQNPVEKPKFGKSGRALNNKIVESFLTDFGQKNQETVLLMKTSMGNMKIRLYNDTPLHRANFIRLVKLDFFDNTVFYRVVKGFAIQGGDTDQKGRKEYKESFGSYSIPAEFKTNRFHKRGALAATRDYGDNPTRRSSPYDFYIVQGTTFAEPDLAKIEREQNYKFSHEQREYYRSSIGAAHLDGEHTVFGEVIDGLNVIDKIAEVKSDDGGWPYEDVTIFDIEILK